MLCAWPLTGFGEESLVEDRGGEERAKQSIRFGGGVEYLGSRDDGGSPLRYEGYAYPIALGYERSRAKSFMRLDGAFSHAGFNSGLLRARIAHGDRHQVEPTVVRLSYGYWRTLAQSSRWSMLLGGALNSLTFFRRYQYDPHQIGTVELWDGVNSLDVSALFRLRLSPGQVMHTRLALPLGGYFVRPSYSVRGDERLHMVREQWRVVTDGHWATWNRMQRVQAEIGYELEVTKRLGLGVDYQFEFFRVTQPAESRGLTNRFTFRGALSF